MWGIIKALNLKLNGKREKQDLKHNIEYHEGDVLLMSNTESIHMRIPADKYAKLKAVADKKSITVATEAKIRLCEQLN